jgi:DNA-binding MarR family transcriptional regulator
MEASRRLELWGRIRQKIPSMDTEFIMAGAPGDKSMEIHLKPHEWMLLCYLHGGRSVRELVELTGYNDFETAKILYGMYAAGLIERLGDEVDA